MSLRDFIKEQTDLVRPEDDDYDLDNDLEEQLNQAMPKLGGDSKVYAYADEQRGEIEVAVELDGIIPMDLINNIAARVAKVTPVQMVGVSGGSGPFAVTFHFGMMR